uniref:Uncharacterized protein n=1 Tax=Nelumbo nucifera TaxID=4432 RepID=A0A822YIX0_NELNU|nr:TPA_asm: hypothetical protein HUJ06_011328 [Nelumbo nucifera]
MKGCLLTGVQLGNSNRGGSGRNAGNNGMASGDDGLGVGFGGNEANAGWSNIGGECRVFVLLDLVIAALKLRCYWKKCRESKVWRLTPFQKLDFVVVIGQILYVLWCRKKFRQQNSTNEPYFTGDPFANPA